MFIEHSPYARCLFKLSEQWFSEILLFSTHDEKEQTEAHKGLRELPTTTEPVKRRANINVKSGWFQVLCTTAELWETLEPLYIVTFHQFYCDIIYEYMLSNYSVQFYNVWQMTTEKLCWSSDFTIPLLPKAFCALFSSILSSIPNFQKALISFLWL